MVRWNPTGQAANARAWVLVLSLTLHATPTQHQDDVEIPFPTSPKELTLLSNTQKPQEFISVALFILNWIQIPLSSFHCSPKPYGALFAQAEAYQDMLRLLTFSSALFISAQPLRSTFCFLVALVVLHLVALTVKPLACQGTFRRRKSNAIL